MYTARDRWQTPTGIRKPKYDDLRVPHLTIGVSECWLLQYYMLNLLYTAAEYKVLCMKCLLERLADEPRRTVQASL